jgi:hypothetical protein
MLADIGAEEIVRNHYPSVVKADIEPRGRRAACSNALHPWRSDDYDDHYRGR